MPLPGPWHGKSLHPKYLGDRSTQYGGEWNYCREFPAGGCRVKNEIWAVLDAIPGIEGNLARSTLDRMMVDAEKGTLRFGEHEDVGVIQRVPDLLELRVQINPHDDSPANRHLLRLYFAEPPSDARLLLALKFAKKPSGADVDGVQDVAINDARYRYENGARNDYHWGI